MGQSDLPNINYNGPEWAALKQALLTVQERKVNLLVQAETHDASNKIRGAIQLLTEILAWEKAAIQRIERGR